MLFCRTSALLLLDPFEQTVMNPLRTFGTMSYHDEEYPGQPLWQSVLLFCCKGMIEWIMVILFFWLLVQVLFTKQLEVHLQILLLVGLTVFCLTLILGCIICCTKSQMCSGEDKASVTSAQAPVEPVTPAQNQNQNQNWHSTGTTAASRQLYEEPEADPSEYPSTFISPAPSQDEFLPGLFSDRAQPACEENQQATSCFSPRRFSSPLQTAPLYKPIHPSRASLPSLPKLGLWTKTCKALQRRCSASEDSRSCNEHSRLDRHTMSSAVTPGNSIPLVPLNYGSNKISKQLFSSKPCLHFTMAFSAEQQTLAVTVLSLTGMPQGMEGLTVLGSLPPLHTTPTPAAFQSCLGHKPGGPVLFLNVSSEEELQSCELRLAVNEQRTHGAEGSTLGEVVVKCGGRAWRQEHPVHLVKELTHKNLKVEQSLQSLSSQDALVCQGLSCPPQIYIGLQYHALKHCIKTTIIRAENLDYLTHSSLSLSAAADYQVVINLHYKGVLISSRETSRESCTVCNASFLFHLPPGDISQLPVLLEFLIVQSRALSEGQVVGRVLLGAEAAGAGRAHWTDMVSLQGQARWHIVQAETCDLVGAATMEPIIVEHSEANVVK